MNVARYREQAQKGLTSLEEAVLGVMFEANVPLKYPEIGGHLGISVYIRGSGRAHYIVADILNRLDSEGLVRQVDSGGPWVLTDKARCLLKGK